MYKEIKSEMVTYPMTAEPDVSVEDGLLFMRERGVRHLPVVDKENNLMGVVSERDLDSAKGKGLFVQDVMTESPFIVYENTNLKAVVETMADYKYGSVLIVNEDHKLTGIFTTIDALRLLARFLDSELEADWIPDNVVDLKEVITYY